ncbi:MULTISPECIES: hypothetical protein [Actinomycetes]|uniref:Mercuric ion transport protein n=2 Tax=Actinomycetes TaxID=1760 RepID=A0A3D9UKR1_9MICO|nr:hypothetical protein [Calidifontibacter indicus]REF30052.1 hypothetical protein DFJ65_1045 [Calidifontibacter indicus]
MTPHHDDQPGRAGLLLGAGAAFLMVACCALLPLLVAGGALAGVGAFLRNPWVIGAGVALLAFGGVAATRRPNGGDNAGHDCCTPMRTTEHDPKDEQNR